MFTVLRSTYGVLRTVRYVTYVRGALCRSLHVAPFLPYFCPSPRFAALFVPFAQIFDPIVVPIFSRPY